MKYCNEENKKLGKWLKKTKTGNLLLLAVKTPTDLERICNKFAKNNGGKIAGLETYDENQGALNWVCFGDLFNELGLKKPVKNKFVLVTLRIQNGEYQYYSKSVHEISIRKSTDKFGNNYAKDFYSNFSHTDGDVHYFNGGEVAVEDKGTTEITKEEYNILNKYL